MEERKFPQKFVHIKGGCIVIFKRKSSGIEDIPNTSEAMVDAVIMYKDLNKCLCV